MLSVFEEHSIRAGKVWTFSELVTSAENQGQLLSEEAAHEFVVMQFLNTPTLQGLVQFKINHSKKKCKLHSINVTSNYQKQKLGSLLLYYVIKRAKSEDCALIKLTSTVAGQRLYESYGFIPYFSTTLIGNSESRKSEYYFDLKEAQALEQAEKAFTHALNNGIAEYQEESPSESDEEDESLIRDPMLDSLCATMSNVTEEDEVAAFRNSSDEISSDDELQEAKGVTTLGELQEEINKERAESNIASDESYSDKESSTTSEKLSELRNMFHQLLRDDPLKR